MKTEELAERLDDTELVLAQQGKRIAELENREINFPEGSIPDYSDQFKELKAELVSMRQVWQAQAQQDVNLTVTNPIKELKAHMDTLNSTLDKIPQVIPIEHHYYFEDQAKAFIISLVILLVLTAVSVGLAYGFYVAYSSRHDNDIKFRMIRQRNPAAARWADTTFYRDRENAEKVTERLEAEDAATQQKGQEGGSVTKHSKKHK